MVFFPFHVREGEGGEGVEGRGTRTEGLRYSTVFPESGQWQCRVQDMENAGTQAPHYLWRQETERLKAAVTAQESPWRSKMRGQMCPNNPPALGEQMGHLHNQPSLLTGAFADLSPFLSKPGRGQGARLKAAASAAVAVDRKQGEHVLVEGFGGHPSGRLASVLGPEEPEVGTHLT